MKQQKGFTLIELIIVIVILGILAVTAAPRFIDIQSDARKETLQGVKAAVQGASQLVYAKAAIAGVQKAESGTVTILGASVATKFGYPDGNSIVAAADLQKFVDVDLNTGAVSAELELENDAGSTTDNKFRIRFENTLSSDVSGSEKGCYIQYVSAASAGATPTFTVFDNDC